jgi:hypothetical protein
VTLRIKVTTNAGFSWGNALLWAAAADIGLGIARVVSRRIATMSWEVATGPSPRGLWRIQLPSDLGGLQVGAPRSKVISRKC